VSGDGVEVGGLWRSAGWSLSSEEKDAKIAITHRGFLVNGLSIVEPAFAKLPLSINSTVGHAGTGGEDVSILNYESSKDTFDDGRRRRLLH
jgi:hypothetical protein